MASRKRVDVRDDMRPTPQAAILTVRPRQCHAEWRNYSSRFVLASPGIRLAAAFLVLVDSQYSGAVLHEVNAVYDTKLSPGQLLAQIGGMIQFGNPPVVDERPVDGARIVPLDHV